MALAKSALDLIEGYSSLRAGIQDLYIGKFLFQFLAQFEGNAEADVFFEGVIAPGAIIGSAMAGIYNNGLDHRFLRCAARVQYRRMSVV